MEVEWYAILRLAYPIPLHRVFEACMGYAFRLREVRKCILGTYILLSEVVLSVVDQIHNVPLNDEKRVAPR
jgi:hypothetical protein